MQAMALAVMFLLLLMPITNAQSGPNSVGEERLSMVSLSANQHEVLTLQVAANSTTLLSWNCLSCQVVVETSSPEATTSAHGSTMRSVAANQTTDIQLNISSTVDETVALLTIHGIQLGF